MKPIIAWWYRFSLPRSISVLPTTPRERERLRYMRLTSSFLLLISLLSIPSGALMIFDSPPGSSSPRIALCMFAILLISFFCGRVGWQVTSALCIITYNLFIVTSVLATNPLDPSLFSIAYTLLFAVILAGALLPPVAALIVAVINCIDVILIAMLVPHTSNYVAAMNKGLYSVSIFLPICIQIGIAVIVYVIMNNLLHTINRADRAEEIVALQEEMSAYEQARMDQQARLEEGIRKIADVHAKIANGDLHARVSLTEGDVLWSVAVPLNNLLNRLQGSLQAQDELAQTQQAAKQITEQLQLSIQSQKSVRFATTGTMLDPIVLEINKLMKIYAQLSAQHR